MKMTNDSDLKIGQMDQTTERSENSSTERGNSLTDANTRQRPKTEAEKRQAVADLFKGNAPAPDPDPAPEAKEWFPKPDEDGEQAQAPEAPAKPGKLTPASLAEKLDMEAAEVYKMDVPLSDGTTAKLSELKDLWQGREAARAEIAQKAAGLNSREAEIIADRQVWSQLAIDGELPTGTVEKVRANIARQHQREQSLLFDLVPELQDEAKLDLFRRDAMRVLGEVGYQPHQVVINDHKQALFIRRYVQMERELSALREANKPKPPKARQGNGRPLNPTQPNRPLGHRDKTVAAVSDLLNGKRT